MSEGKHPIENLMMTAMPSLESMVDVNTIVGDMVSSPDGTSRQPRKTRAVRLLAPSLKRHLPLRGRHELRPLRQARREQRGRLDCRGGAEGQGDRAVDDGENL